MEGKLLKRNSLDVKWLVFCVMYVICLQPTYPQASLNGSSGDYLINAYRFEAMSNDDGIPMREYIDQRGKLNRKIAVQNRIAELRSKKFFAAVYLNMENLEGIFWSAGGEKSENMVADAGKGCGPACKLVAVFSNTCMMLAEPRGNVDVSRVVVAYDPLPEQAIEKAKDACTDKYGKDCVAYERMPEARHRAYCVGYDYGVYDDGR